MKRQFIDMERACREERWQAVFDSLSLPEQIDSVSPDLSLSKARYFWSHFMTEMNRIEFEHVQHIESAFYDWYRALDIDDRARARTMAGFRQVVYRIEDSQ